MVYLWAVGVWFVFLVIAFGVGAVREGLLRPRIGAPRAHVIGTLIAVALMMLVIYASVGRLHEIPSISDLILIGVIWLIITVAFEFGFFHYVMGNTLTRNDVRSQPGAAGPPCLGHSRPGGARNSWKEYKPWETLLADYNVLRGRIWVLVLATVLLGPIIVGTLVNR